MTQIKKISTQLAIFIEGSISRPDRFFEKLNTDLGEIIDQMPQVMPVPQEIPFEMPIVVGSSVSGKYSLNISKNRIDFIQNYSATEDNKKQLLEFKSKCKLALSLSGIEYKISRIGMVGNFYVESQNPSAFITKKFFKKEDQNLEEASIRTNKISNEFGVKFNNVFSLSVATIGSQNYNGPAVIIQADSNILPNQPLVSKETLIEIFEKKSSAYSDEYINERVS